MISGREKPSPGAGAQRSSSLPRVLDLGCGTNKRPNSYGVDRRPHRGVDLVHDLEQTPWPLPADSFDVVICSHIVEHIADVPGFMHELHRVSAQGGRIHIETPHFSSLESWSDPTHRQHFSLHSFDFFADPNYLGHDLGFCVLEARLTFRKALTSRFGALLFRFFPRHYEQNAAYLLPARDVHVVLEVVKG